MKKRNRNYSLSFKQKAVELSFSRGNVKQVCEELSILYYIVGEKNQLLMERTVFQVEESQN